jgi:hypothetical protein
MNPYKRTHKELEIIMLDCYTIQMKRSFKFKNLDSIKVCTRAVNYEERKMQRKVYRVERSVSMGVVVSLCEGV